MEQSEIERMDQWLDAVADAMERPIPPLTGAAESVSGLIEGARGAAAELREAVEERDQLRRERDELREALLAATDVVRETRRRLESE